MSNNKTLNTQFIFRVFILSVIINAVGYTAYILHPAPYTLMDTPRIFTFAAWTSIALFIPVFLMFYFIILATKNMLREKTYFIILISSMVLPWLVWMLATKLFAGYGDMWAIVGIAAFSALVSVAFYYEFFMNEEKEQPA